MPILEEHKEILAAESASKTLPGWVEFFDSQYTKNQLYSFCYCKNYPVKRNNKELSKGIRKYNINQDYFKRWSNNMSYTLGLWYAKGFIYSDKIFDITLHTKDKYLLKQIAKELKFEGNLCDSVDKQVSRLNFSCAVIYNDIVRLGGLKKKYFPNIPKKYLPDFIRGFFDGCGKVYDVKGKRINIAFTYDFKPFLKRFLQILQEETEIQGGSFYDFNHSLKFGKRDSLRLFNYMYKNDSNELFLKRKKDRFLKYI